MIKVVFRVLILSGLYRHINLLHQMCHVPKRGSFLIISAFQMNGAVKGTTTPFTVTCIVTDDKMTSHQWHMRIGNKINHSSVCDDG